MFGYVISVNARSTSFPSHTLVGIHIRNGDFPSFDSSWEAYDLYWIAGTALELHWSVEYVWIEVASEGFPCLDRSDDAEEGRRRGSMSDVYEERNNGRGGALYMYFFAYCPKSLKFRDSSHLIAKLPL